MKSMMLDVPAMYADHPVLEVRRILLELPGVESVDASSAFRVVEIGYDETGPSEEAIRKALDGAGYLAELETPAESGMPVDGPGSEGQTWFRHTAAREAMGESVAFEQTVPACGRALWPCPGTERGGKNED